MLWRNSTYVFMTLGFVAYTFALGGLAGWMPAFLERYNGMNAVILNCVPAAIRATAMAVNIFLIHALGDVISPPIIGILSDHFGLFPATLAAPAMMVVSGAILLYAIRSYRGGARTGTAAARILSPDLRDAARPGAAEPCRCLKKEGFTTPRVRVAESG